MGISGQGGSDRHNAARNAARAGQPEQEREAPRRRTQQPAQALILQAAQVPAARVPAAQVPAAQVPAARVPAAQVPAARVPEARVPAARVPAAQDKFTAMLLRRQQEDAQVREQAGYKIEQLNLILDEDSRAFNSFTKILRDDNIGLVRKFIEVPNEYITYDNLKSFDTIKKGYISDNINVHNFFNQPIEDLLPYNQNTLDRIRIALKSGNNDFIQFLQQPNHILREFDSPQIQSIQRIYESGDNQKIDYLRNIPIDVLQTVGGSKIEIISANHNNNNLNIAAFFSRSIKKLNLLSAEMMNVILRNYNYNNNNINNFLDTVSCQKIGELYSADSLNII